MAGVVVAGGPFAGELFGGGGTGELGADRHQVAGDGEVERAGGFDGDVVVGGAEFFAEGDEFGEEHGFAAGDDDVADGGRGVGVGLVGRRPGVPGLVPPYGESLDFLEDFFDGAVLAFGPPGGVGGVAEPAAEVAAAGADEDAGRAGEEAFALE